MTSARPAPEQERPAAASEQGPAAGAAPQGAPASPPIARSVPEPARPSARARRGAGRLGAMKDRLRSLAHLGLDPLVDALAAIGTRADHVTVLGTLLSAASGLAFYEGQFPLGSGLLLLSGVCDILDGQLARRSGQISTFGAFLDSTLDRFAEAAVLLGIMGFYLRNLLALVF